MKARNIFIISLIAIWVYLFVSLFVKDNSIDNCINTKYVREESIQGKVISKEENNWNHAIEIAYFSNGSDFRWSDDVWKVPGFYKNIDIGDSIRKAKGSYIVEIYKLDTTIYFDMLRNCKNYKDKNE